MNIRHDTIVAMTGASGAVYGLRLIARLGQAGIHQHLLLSEAARIVLEHEQGLKLPDQAEDIASRLANVTDIPAAFLTCYGLKDWFSAVASGSAGMRRMVIIPCSMGCLARVATGASDNLIERAADVMLKESRQLILVPRETPLSSIHLEHMLKLSRLGVEMIPAMPGFYHRPQKVSELVDFVVDRVMDHLGIESGRKRRWGNQSGPGKL